MATEPHSWGAHDDFSAPLHQAASIHSHHSVTRDDYYEIDARPRSSARDASPYELQTIAHASRDLSRHSQTSQTLDAPPQHDDVPTPSPSRQDLSKDDPYSCLPEHESSILRSQTDVPTAKIKYKDLFRYASRADFAIIAVSAVCAIAAGVALPAMTIIFGSLTGTFRGYFSNETSTSNFNDSVNQMALDLVYIGIGMFAATYVYTVGFIHTGERIAGKIRREYLSGVLRQNIGYFDKLGSGEITTRITADTNTIQDGVSEKLGLIIQALATFIGAYVIGLIKFWKLALILMSSVVATVGTTVFLSRFLMKYARLNIASYAAGGNIVEESISSIRTAVAFGTQETFANRYDTHLARAERAGFRAKFVQSSILSSMMLYIYLTYSLGFWMASKYITDGEASLSQCITVLLSIMIGSFSLGNVAPSFQALTSSVAAATKVFATIDRLSPLDPTSGKGDTISNLRGEVELRDIKHIYPSRPEVVVAEDLNLVVPAGKTTALVGASGSGKSTIVGLVERFYDPVGGQVLLDGVELKNLNLRWLRQQISLVSQEPTLFATTIRENIRFGLIGTHFENSNLAGEKESDLIEIAAKMSNAHDFISALPDGYETHVGERGFLLSGGQKQRIAIARAIVSNPRILLLDEATSALDTKSEGVVQAALDKASEGRTTIVIAHRLSTIKNADNIVVMSAGKIVEQGRHEDLLQQEGVYHGLVEAQRIGAEVAQKQQASIELEDEQSDDYFSDGRPSGPSEDNKLDQNDKFELSRTKSSGALSRKSTPLPSNIASLKGASDGPKYSLWTLIKTILAFNRSEWPQMALGALTAIIAGSGQPVQSVFFAESISNLARPSSEYSELRSQQDFWSWMYFMLAFVLLIMYQISGTIFAWCSEKLIRRARLLNFRYLLRQDIGFFDREENSAGVLTSFLSTETASLAGISGSTLGTILQVSATLIVGFIISIVIAWKFALVCIATIPLLLAAGFLRFWMLSRYQARAKQAYEKSAAYACEATSAIRTVASLTREADVWETYNGMIMAQEAASLKSILQSSSLYATAQSMLFFCIALAFWWGSQLIVDGYLDLFQYYVCYQACLFGAQSAGIIFSFAPEMGKAKNAARTMKRLFDRQPEIDFWATNEGQMMDTVHGKVEFQNVHFRYPTRPEQPVLRGLDMEILPGQYIALVGASGCGKSTTISLLEKFYNPTSGDILVDSQPITKINVNSLRKHIALVSQEPTLYQGTIRENILLGCVGDEDVSQERIVQTCKDANIHDFIMSLPDGFETVVGNKGGMLSGGQKQRVAIARALLRDPRILLLDEATSALDSESEKVVQAALDRAAQGRTTIAVAHRLSTIQKADKIFVFDTGRVVESGTHAELVKLRGRYHELVSLQTLGGA